MEDAGPVVRVQRRDARLRAQLDAPVRLRAVRGIAEGLDVGILDVDSDPCRYDHTLAVHEDVEMRVDVMRESLLALRLQPRGNGEAQRVFRGSPGSRAVRRLRRGVDHGRCGRGLEQQAGQDGDTQDENARGAASGGFADRADPSVIRQVVDSHVIPPALVREPRRRIRLVPNDSIAREPRQQWWSWSSSASRHQTSGALAPFVCARAHEGGARSDAAHKWHKRPGRWRTGTTGTMRYARPQTVTGTWVAASPVAVRRGASGPPECAGDSNPPGPSPEHVRVPQQPPANRAFDDQSGQRWRASSVVRRGISATDRIGCGPPCSAPTTGSSPPRAWCSEWRRPAPRPTRS